MKSLKQYSLASAIATASCLTLGLLPVQAGTFSFSLDFGTALSDPTYDPQEHGSIGRSTFSGTITGEDLNGNGWLTATELTEFSATWGNLEFGLGDIELFFGRLSPPDGVTILDEYLFIHGIRLARNNIHLDYRPFDRISDLYQQFRAYECPTNFDCSANFRFDDAVSDGKIPTDNILGSENVFVAGFPAFQFVEPPPPPTTSVPEPSIVAGLGVLALAGWRKKRK